MCTLLQETSHRTEYCDSKISALLMPEKLPTVFIGTPCLLRAHYLNSQHLAHPRQLSGLIVMLSTQRFHLLIHCRLIQLKPACCTQMALCFCLQGCWHHTPISIYITLSCPCFCLQGCWHQPPISISHCHVHASGSRLYEAGVALTPAT